MFIKHQKGNLIYFTSSLFEKYNVPHFFATRFGGVSSGCFDSLNFSLVRQDINGQEDKEENILENCKIAMSLLDETFDSSVFAHQTHTNIVKKVNDNDSGNLFVKYSKDDEGFDGLVLDKELQKAKVLCIRTADCTPILLFDTKTGNIGALHAGWRGTVTNIVENGIKELGAHPKDVICAIGPCINKCCYEVGHEVFDAAKTLFEQKGIQDRLSECFTFENDRIFASLPDINSCLLQSVGVKKENIDVSGICTCCTKDENNSLLFFSHRGMKGHSGTFLSAVKRV